ncbi:crotonase/enoyl-CoA hydratase family protein [Sandaracinobacteroides saxicola]|uniref:Crotonase/enoyl-CoA hydratase family protein n=1 Tax=Sandaracinobacteroides saxicola TaxID=2759707 RepID=A0A7G5IG77_9SPHN|nr:crotonase/enoyl-CoA hydratase family protein [Sandaracinobacteroides saxicola]QMW22369.1 crotonase/enoyl-CoA hydratase family protein [Sandaracinobacteroides saxicola]
MAFVTTTVHGRIARLTLSAPDSLNAIGTLQDCDDFVAAITALDDPGISVAILTGEGRAFSTGGNLKAMHGKTGIGPGDQPATTRDTYRRGVQRISRALAETEVPLIAAINGHAIGLGLDIACLCDIRLAASTARMAASFIKVGLVPGDGGAWALSRVVGHSKAAELFLTGDPFDAAEALRIGLVSRVTPPETLLDEAMALAGRIAANPPRALRLTKRLLREAQNQRLGDILELSAAYQALAHETADHAEAVAAFLEKRSASFSGN